MHLKNDSNRKTGHLLVIKCVQIVALLFKNHSNSSDRGNMSELNVNLWSLLNSKQMWQMSAIR